jgi:hypothetical protein
MGATQANFLEIKKQVTVDNSGIPGTTNTSHSEINDEIDSVNFFLLYR